MTKSSKKMKSRDESVLILQITLTPILAKYWKLDFIQLSKIFKEYEVLEYIDLCYEKFNSTGIQGVIDEIEDWIKIQGGSINKNNSRH